MTAAAAAKPTAADRYASDKYPREATIEDVDVVPTPEQAAYAAAELRAVLKMLGHGEVIFFRDCSSYWPDQPSRDAIRERIARLDVYAGQVAPLVPEGSNEVPEAVSYCDKGPCGDRLNHDGKCTT